jgi:hypothetical protein
MTAFSFFFVKEVDSVVHGDLYNYGLVFNFNWADKYWNYSNLFLYFQTLALVLFGNALALLLSHIRNRNTFSISASSLLLLAGAGLSVFALYFLFRLDSIVNSDLYLYGLIFNVEWYGRYLLDYRLALMFAALAGFSALASAIVLYTSAKKISIVPVRLLHPTLIAIGTISLAFSIIYYSSILALIGLGLLFWGITFVYISTDEYVKKVVLETLVSSQIETLNHLLRTLEFAGDAIYLPPKYFKNSNTYGVYIPKDRLARLPTPEMMPEKQPDFLFSFIENPKAVLVTPPGAKLAQLFEKALETNFNRVNLEYLQQNLPGLIVEDLEIAQSFDMEIEDDKVRIELEGSVYSDPRIETEQLGTYSSFGSPLSSAIACSIAKVTGKPIVRTSSKTDFKAKRVIEEYVMLQMLENAQ